MIKETEGRKENRVMVHVKTLIHEYQKVDLLTLSEDGLEDRDQNSGTLCKTLSVKVIEKTQCLQQYVKKTNL